MEKLTTMRAACIQMNISLLVRENLENALLLDQEQFRENWIISFLELFYTYF
jgi:hypothetical protein